MHQRSAYSHWTSLRNWFAAPGKMVSNIRQGVRWEYYLLHRLSTIFSPRKYVRPALILIQPVTSLAAFISVRSIFPFDNPGAGFLKHECAVFCRLGFCARGWPRRVSDTLLWKLAARSSISDAKLLFLCPLSCTSAPSILSMLWGMASSLTRYQCYCIIVASMFCLTP
jgi:hypothetical protein